MIPISAIGAGVDWKVGGLGSEARLDTAAGAEATTTSGSSFGQMLTSQIGALEQQQVKAGEATRALADGTATDPSAVVVAVEKARLSMQLASQLRTKGLEAFNDIIHTQV